MNLFDLPDLLPDREITEELIRTSGFRAERILSAGQTSPEGFWYDQNEDEWVFLLQGEAKIEFDDKTIVCLKKGDQLFIPAHKRHRVAYTSTGPVCIWLCIFGYGQLG